MDNIKNPEVLHDYLADLDHDEDIEENSCDVTYGIHFVMINGRFVDPATYDLVVRDNEKFTIPKTYRFGQCRICSDQDYVFYPGTTYAINDGRVLEYSEQFVKIYEFQDNPLWTEIDGNTSFQNPCHTAFSVQTWNVGLTDLLLELWGYADQYGRIVVPARYDCATNSSCWNVGAVKQHNKWHFIYVLTGERIDKREYDDVALCPETGYFSYSAKEQGEGRGLIDPLGNVVTRPIYGTMPRPMFDGTFKTFALSNPEVPLLIDRYEKVLSHPDVSTSDILVEAYNTATYNYNDVRETDIFDSEIPCILVVKEDKYGLMAYSGRKITDIDIYGITEVLREKSRAAFSSYRAGIKRVALISLVKKFYRLYMIVS